MRNYGSLERESHTHPLRYRIHRLEGTQLTNDILDNHPQRYRIHRLEGTQPTSDILDILLPRARRRVL